jgi:hypothetical protein
MQDQKNHKHATNNYTDILEMVSQKLTLLADDYEGKELLH